MLHELSIERNRLKDEQQKLERLSAPLMIDLQSSLITSGDDQVIVSAPEGSLRRSDAGSWLSLVGGRQQLDTSNADINVSNHHGTVLTPRSTNLSRHSPTQQLDHAHRKMLSRGSPSDTLPGTPRGRRQPSRTHGHLQGSRHWHGWAAATPAHSALHPLTPRYTPLQVGGVHEFPAQLHPLTSRYTPLQAVCSRPSSSRWRGAQAPSMPVTIGSGGCNPTWWRL